MKIRKYKPKNNKDSITFFQKKTNLKAYRYAFILGGNLILNENFTDFNCFRD